MPAGNTVGVPHAPGADRWFLRWACTTAAAGIVATVLDAALLQRDRGYFTGGFLAVDHVTDAAEGFGFVAGSLLSDTAVIGMITALVLWGFARAPAKRHAVLAVAFIVGLAPLMIADFVAYRLLAYLGDAFDLGLMFDLAGRNPMELIAVSSAHLPIIGCIFGGALVAIAGVVWMARRRTSIRNPHAVRPTMKRVLAFPLTLLVVGAVGTATLRSSSDVLDNGLRRKPSGRWLGQIVELLTDVDRDGFGALGRPDDPNLFDSRIRPYAAEIPGNGVDEDGVAGDLPATVEPYREPAVTSTAWRSTPDVVLFVLESFRADAFGGTFKGKAVTPVLDELARRGVSASHAYSHNGYTVQSRRHIFSGSTAGVQGDSTLLDDFKAHGYETAYFSAQDESFGGPLQGVGFDRADVRYDARTQPELRYTTYTTAGSLAVPYTVLGDRIATYLKTRTPNRPLFMYVNFHDTHFPYHHSQIKPLLNDSVLAPSEITPAHADALRAMYLNTAANMDRAIGQVLMQARSVLKREPAIIVLSDHGESLFDEGFLGHGYALNDAQTRIPLIAENLSITIEEPFGQSDLRNAIGAALEAEPVTAPRPALRSNPSKQIFQYLGPFERPRQIAFTGLDGRIIYDFRTRRAQVGSADWRRPEDLSPAAQGEFLRLLQTWERMILARNGTTSEEDGSLQ